MTSSSLTLFAQQEPAISTIGSTEIDAPVDWLASTFADRLKQVDLVGLGEVSHGSSDIFKLKAKLVQYLVEREGYKTLLFELDDARLRPLNAYLCNKSPANIQIIDSLFNKQFNQVEGSLSLNNIDLKNLLNWLKGYNLAHPSGFVSLRGIDNNISFEYIKKHYMDTASVKWMHDTYGIKNISLAEGIKMVDTWYAKFGADIMGRLSPAEQINLKMDLENFKSDMRYNNGGGEKNRAMMTLRDSMMSVNVAQLKNGKTMVWAHNMHIVNSDFVKVHFRAKMLGHFLKEKYNKEYFVILTDFSDHALINVMKSNDLFKPRNFTSNKNSLASRLFHQFNISSGIVFSEELNNKGLPYGFNNIGLSGEENFAEGAPTGFDMLFFFKDIHPARIVQ